MDKRVRIIEVYLVDYGFSFPFRNYKGDHKSYDSFRMFCHRGTLPFTSIDAHDGANPSRRGDLEILGYCLLQWSGGRLPWEDCLDDVIKVASLKRRYKDAPTDLVKDCIKGNVYPKYLQKYMECIYKLSYEETPKYKNLKHLFLKELKDNGMSDNGTGLDWISGGGGGGERGGGEEGQGEGRGQGGERGGQIGKGGGGRRGEGGGSGLKGRKRKRDPEPETEYKEMPKAKGRKTTQIEALKKPSKKKAVLPVCKVTPPLPDGTILSGFTKREWRLGKSIRNGGFGLINEVSPTTKSSGSYAIKVKPQDNGPLFCEIAFYRRAATSDLINDWVKSHDLKYLAIPQFIDSGKHMQSSFLEYRFLVMERFGDNIEKLFEKAGSKFGVKTVCYLALRILEALEYLHDSNYVHANIKGAHILTGYSERDQVYLVDYGLAFRYSPNGEHKPYKPDPRSCHDGTIEFTSIDAHDGASPSRRGDLEILGYCLLQWSCGRLPWEDCIDDKPNVARLKRRYKDVPTNLINDCFKGKACPKCLKNYMECIYKLSYEETPKYNNLRHLFLKELKVNGMSDDGTGLDWISGRGGRLKGWKRKHDPEPEAEMPLVKGRKVT